MYSFHTSEYNYVYICYIEKQIYNNLQKTLYRDCISLYISKAVKFFLKKLAYKCIYFLDFYPATRMWTANPVTIKRNAVILTITCVYSRVVDMSKENAFFVIIFNYFVTATL